MEERDVVVIGAGHNGLCAATLLARRGLDVLAVERRDVVGGAAVTEELLPGFRFSTCAYAAHLLHPKVLAALGVELEELRLLPLPPPLVVLPDGHVVRRDADDQDGSLRDALGSHDAGAARRWTADWRVLAGVFERFVLDEPPTLEDLAVAADDGHHQETFARFATKSVEALLEDTFASPAARAAFAPTYFEDDPSRPGGPLSYLYTALGELRPRALRGLPTGGMGTVTRAFARAAHAAGVEVRTGSEVASIEVEDGRAAGVCLADGNRLAARAVVSSCDPKRTLRLLPTGTLPSSLDELPAAPAGAKLHCALRGDPDLSLLGGNSSAIGLVHVLPTHDWLTRGYVDATSGAWPQSSLVELQLPTLHDSTLAPAGCQVLSVFLPLAPPRLASGPWDERRDELADLLLERAAAAIPNVRELVIDRVVHTPADIERRVGLTGGNIHHLPHTLALLGAGRPLAGFADGGTPLPSLFLCGAGIHPGGEVSGAPGFNAARVVAEALTASG